MTAAALLSLTACTDAPPGGGPALPNYPVQLPSRGIGFIPNSGATATPGSGATATPGSGATATPGSGATATPALSETSPGNGAVGVGTNGRLSVTFSTAMDPSTINTSTFTLRQGSTPVSGTVSYSGTTATFTPAASLAANSTFTATVTTGARSLAGNSLASNFTWTFTTGATADTTPPVVSAIAPAAGATSVPVNQKVAVQFSEAMDPATISGTSFTVSQGGAAVAGTVTYAGTTATFSPSSNLAANTTFTATVTTSNRDLAGNAMVASFVWTFTSAAAGPDTTPPVVSAISPADGSLNVGVKQAITVTFSEAMDPLTLTTQTFTVRAGANPAVVGTVSYALSGSTATFTTASDFPDNTLFTATVSTGARDLAGNPLASPKVWTFTTGQAPPNLGRASGFALMATASIDGSPGSQINGDVGLDPGSSITIPRSEVNGTIHVKDQAIIDAQADLNNAYNDAVVKATNVVVRATGELGGATITPGLYKAPAGSFGITSVDLTLDALGNPNAVFIFQMPSSTLTVGVGRSVILAGGAKAGNVYWQVGSSATLNTNTTFKGNVLANISITVNNGSNVVGRLLAGTGPGGAGSVTFNASTITVPGP